MEKDIEKKLVDEINKQGGMCLKLTSRIGIPDRLVLLEKGCVAFVEVKDKGKKPRPIQVKVMKDLERLGFRCFILDDKKEVKSLVQKIGGDFDDI